MTQLRSTEMRTIGEIAHTFLTTSAPQVSSIQESLTHSLKEVSIHLLISEDQCLRMHIQTLSSLPTFTTIGLTENEKQLI